MAGAATSTQPLAESGRDRTASTSRVLRLIMIGLAVIGLGIATYLTVAHYAGFTILCTTKHNSCEQVQQSVYAKVAGVPVALLGAIGYVAILVTLLIPEREATRLATLGITVFGFGFSAYLTYREVFTLKEICEWCVSSAIVMTLLLGLSIARYLLGESQPPVAPR
jgi:uncharacterized membrane protein